MTFFAPDLKRFPALRLAREALEAGGHAPCVLNAANEIAVDAFLQGRIAFLDIASVCERALETLGNDTAFSRACQDIQSVMQFDGRARAAANEHIVNL